MASTVATSDLLRLARKDPHALVRLVYGLNDLAQRRRRLAWLLSVASILGSAGTVAHAFGAW